MDEAFFGDFARDAHDEGLRFLIVGGHAVNAYGYERTTLDADVLVEDTALSRWRLFWERRGYRCVHATEAFCQFRSSDVTLRYPVDLMIVGSATFEKLWARQEKRRIGDAVLGIPHPLHLIALKLHAMRNEARARQGKDLPDILGLIRHCDIDTESLEFKEVLSRYADETLRARIGGQLHGLA